MDQFNSLLLNLMRPEKEFRVQAEKVYDEIPINEKVKFLFQAISDDERSEEIRHFSSILLRRLFFSSFDDIKASMDSNSMEQMKVHLIVLLQKDNITVQFRKKICDVASELAHNCIDSNGLNSWPELLQFMFSAAESNNLDLRDCALSLIFYYPSIFGADQNKYLDYIKKMLMKCLCEESNDSVKLSALKATTAFILLNSDDKAIVKLFSETALPMLQNLNYLIQKDEEEAVQQIVDIVDKCPQLFRTNFTHLMDICMTTIKDENLSDKVKNLALEVIISFSENASATFRKRGQVYLPPLITHLLMMMTDIDDDENWALSEDSEDEVDSDSPNIIGETSLDRLACGIGGKSVITVAMSIVSQMLQNSDWKQRYAALMAISALGEGCHKEMQHLLNDIVNAILKFVTDPHPRVRYACCNALGQMATDFAPEFELKFHSNVIPALMLLLDDVHNPRVQGHAAAAFVNFFEESDQKVILQYSDGIATKFEAILSAKMKDLTTARSRLLLEQIVVSIASLADTVQEVFIKYYDVFMPSLKYIIDNATSKEYRLLRGKSIECASLIGLALKDHSESFINDASQIMNMLLSTQTGELILEDDDPQLPYMITSWCRICQLLGSKFEPYLPMVMPQVLKTAAKNIEMAVLDEDEVKSYEENQDWQTYSFSDQQCLGIKVAGLEDKGTACEMLVCYARELKHSFVDYVEETAKILVPLMKCYFHEATRIAAAQSPPILLECAKVRGEAYVHELWNYILPIFLSAIEGESEKTVLAEMFVSMAECIIILGKQSLNEEQLKELIRVLDGHFNEYFERVTERQSQRQDEDYDEYVEEELKDEDEDDVYILAKIVDILHSLFKSYNENFFPFFNLLSKHIINLANPERPINEQQWAICVMDDLIEFCGPKCVEYQDFFLPLLSSNIKSPHAQLRQAAAYGFGMLAKHGGETFAQIVADTVPIMVEIIQDVNSRLAENLAATDNCVSAVTRIMEFNNSRMDVESLIPIWLNWLPIWEDEEEAHYVYSFLYKLLERNHPKVLGENNCNIPRIVAVILEVFARDTIESKGELGLKLIAFIKYVNLEPSVIQTFTAEQQMAYRSIMI